MLRAKHLWATALLLAAPLAASGPNLLSNPGFDTSAAGWEGHNPLWSSADVNGDPHSGALRDVFSSTTPSQAELDFECLPAAPGPYVESASAWVDGTPGDSGYLWFFFYPQTNCAGVSSNDFTSTSTTTAGWTRLDVAGVAPAGTQSVGVSVVTKRGLTPSGAETTFWDNVYFGTGTCAPTATSLCLNGGRFRVTAHWATPSQSGDGTAVPFADESGSFWFFAPSNIELDVKVIDGCSNNHRYWVFVAGLTNVGVTLTVTDTLKGGTATYHNHNGHTFSTVTDTAAFNTCP